MALKMIVEDEQDTGAQDGWENNVSRGVTITTVQRLSVYPWSTSWVFPRKQEYSLSCLRSQMKQICKNQGELSSALASFKSAIEDMRRLKVPEWAFG